MKKRLISFLLTVVMLVSLCTAFGTSASADANVIPVPVGEGGTVLKLCQNIGVDYYKHKNLIDTLNGFTSDADYRKLSAKDVVMLPASEAAAVALEGGSATATPLAAALLWKAAARLPHLWQPAEQCPPLRPPQARRPQPGQLPQVRRPLFLPVTTLPTIWYGIPSREVRRSTASTVTGV